MSRDQITSADVPLIEHDTYIARLTDRVAAQDVEIERLRTTLRDAYAWIDNAPWEHQPDHGRASWLEIKARIMKGISNAV